MHLDPYLKEAGQSQTEFGQMLVPPVSQGQISQWVRGVTRITLDYALQIDDRTCGKVTPQDCADMYVEPHLRVPIQSEPDVFSEERRKNPQTPELEREAEPPVMRVKPDADKVNT